MTKRFGAGDYQYEHVEGWGQFPGSGEVSDVATDSEGRVYACVRLGQGPDGYEGEMWVFDREGNHLASWGRDIFDVPHGLWIGPDDDIYHTDAGNHTVTKHNTDGEVLMTLGTKDRAGQHGGPFNSPTRAALSRSGEIFVSDGYRQNRCHRFTAKGELMLSWGRGDPVYSEGTGTPGTGPGEFNIPHDITVDRNDRVYVLDRGNGRLQVFTNEGDFVEQWPDVPDANDTVIDDDDIMHIATGDHGIMIRTLDGKSIGVWGEKGENPGQFRGGPLRGGPHGLWIDSRGDMYVAEIGAPLKLQKFARI